MRRHAGARLRRMAAVSRNRIEAYTDEGTGITYRDVEPILTPAFLTVAPTHVAAVSAAHPHADSRYQGLSFLAPRGDARLTSPAVPRARRRGALCMGRGHDRCVRAQPARSSRVSVGRRERRGTPRYFILAPRSVDVTVRISR